ncbi:arsinothricin resistance N-acetyltransferase ArsN1 family B [Pseudoalteromonas ruthenica]|uniref:arsinothricin resistance N-acetyltransferase ArsN1 family B n=1 Tax=Pseudoalteromonas ruthenica TaxID=151081 RepID=UPI00110A295C|nr:arsinothricin resistance N-acetyltransferase ArsN1 family B [Pseudoalteromonas ruthenica]TMO49030.1 phosphinothricin acetyltransferase [Pseudoalteromonas ruthenica]TMO51159.1 phosphinothricin acetyltransferase [Pseudoalteromonas ruthenica]
MLRHATPEDAKAIAELYNYYIRHTTFTFEESLVDTQLMSQRIASIKAVNLPWLVYAQDGELKGYAYASKWKERSAYRFAVETSVYVAHQHQGQGIGRQLYSALLETLTAQGVHTAIGGITLPNPPSIALHQALGMHKVAHFEKVGYKFEQWLDVGYWQIHLQA